MYEPCTEEAPTNEFPFKPCPASHARLSNNANLRFRPFVLLSVIELGTFGIFKFFQ